jgi:hypothetical protein
MHYKSRPGWFCRRDSAQLRGNAGVLIRPSENVRAVASDTRSRDRRGQPIRERDPVRTLKCGANETSAAPRLGYLRPRVSGLAPFSA